jgi:hypothetical protein
MTHPCAVGGRGVDHHDPNLRRTWIVTSPMQQACQCHNWRRFMTVWLPYGNGLLSLLRQVAWHKRQRGVQNSSAVQCGLGNLGPGHTPACRQTVCAITFPRPLMLSLLNTFERLLKCITFRYVARGGNQSDTAVPVYPPVAGTVLISAVVSDAPAIQYRDNAAYLHARLMTGNTTSYGTPVRVKLPGAWQLFLTLTG